MIERSNNIVMKAYCRSLFLMFFLAGAFFSAAALAETTKKYGVGNVAQVMKYIGEAPGTKLVFVFTSWCPFCREKFPDVMALEEVKKGSVIALSIDRDSSKLSRYLNGYKNLPVRSILVKQSYGGELREALSTTYNVKNGDGIPFMVVIDGNNNVLLQGNFPVEEAANLILGQK